MVKEKLEEVLQRIVSGKNKCRNWLATPEFFVDILNSGKINKKYYVLNIQHPEGYFHRLIYKGQRVITVSQRKIYNL